MSTLKENIQKVVDANAAIKSALEAKGVDVTGYSRLSQAAQLIAAIAGVSVEAATGYLYTDAPAPYVEY